MAFIRHRQLHLSRRLLYGAGGGRHHADLRAPGARAATCATARSKTIRWHSDFHDLPAADRVCRHVLTGEFQSRECPHAFDCRECETHAKLVAMHPAGRRPPRPRRISSACPSRWTASTIAATPGRTSEPDGTVTVGLDDLGAAPARHARCRRPARSPARAPRQRHRLPLPQARSRCARALPGGWRSHRDRRPRSRLVPARPPRAARRDATCCAAPKSGPG